MTHSNVLGDIFEEFFVVGVGGGGVFGVFSPEPWFKTQKIFIL